jgi:amidase
VADDAAVVFASIEEQRARLTNGTLTVRQLVSSYFDRILRIDGHTNAFTSLRVTAALEEADRCQHLLANGDRRPLLGIPFAVKDEHSVAGEVTGLGTNAVTTAAARDDDIVGTLRRAGAIPLGRTTMSELGLQPMSDSPTWGITRNPWDLAVTSGGSSGGSAVAVVAGLASFATAADGGGSIRIPASCCRLFGLKVQRGRLDRHDISVAGAMGVSGVLTRRVADAALLYDLLAEAIGGAGSPVWTPSLRSVAASATPGRLRIGVSHDLGVPAAVTPDVQVVMDEFVHRLRTLGHEVFDRPIDAGRWDVPFALLGMRYAVTEAHELEHPDRLDGRTKAIARGGSMVIPPLRRWALARQAAFSHEVDLIFDDVDLILTPTLAHPPVPAGRWQGRGPVRTSLEVARWSPFTPLANLVGNPAASVPAGCTVSGVPIGADFLAARDGEPMLVSLAAQLEGELRWYEARPDVSMAG